MFSLFFISEINFVMVSIKTFIATCTIFPLIFYVLFAMCIIGLILCSFFFIRNNWLYKVHTFYIDLVWRSYLRDCLYEDEELYEFKDLLNIFHPYDLELFMVWKWSLEQLVKKEHIHKYLHIRNNSKGIKFYDIEFLKKDTNYYIQCLNNKHNTNLKEF